MLADLKIKDDEMGGETEDAGDMARVLTDEQQRQRRQQKRRETTAAAKAEKCKKLALKKKRIRKVDVVLAPSLVEIDMFRTEHMADWLQRTAGIHTEKKIEEHQPGSVSDSGADAGSTLSLKGAGSRCRAVFVEGLAAG